MLGQINNCLTFGQNIPPPKNLTIKFTILQRSLGGHESSIMTHEGVNFIILTNRKSKFHLVYHIVSFFARVAPDEYFSTMMTHQIWTNGNIISFDTLKLTGQKTQKKNIFPFQPAKQNHDNNPWCDCILRILTANTYSHLKG